MTEKKWVRSIERARSKVGDPNQQCLAYASALEAELMLMEARHAEPPRMITMGDVKAMFEATEAKAEFVQALHTLITRADQAAIGYLLSPNHDTIKLTIDDPEAMRAALSVSHFGAFLAGVRVANRVREEQA
jgi:hypothetical protein